MRAGLGAGVTGAAGRTGASAATVIRRPGNQPLHPLPEQPRFRYAVESKRSKVKPMSGLLLSRVKSKLFTPERIFFFFYVTLLAEDHRYGRCQGLPASVALHSLAAVWGVAMVMRRVSP